MSVPNGAALTDYINRLSPGDTLSLAGGGTYTLAGGASGFATLKSGTSAQHITIQGNGATITAGAVGIDVDNKQYLDFYDLNITQQTAACVELSNSDHVTFTRCTAYSTSTPGFIDVWKMRGNDDLALTDCVTQTSTGASTCDGFEFWGPSNRIVLTRCIAYGLNNGPTTNDGHGFEIYGESGAEICDDIQFIECEAYACRVGFTSEGGASENALHTNCVAINCNSHDNVEYDYGGLQGATLYRQNSAGTTTGNVVDL